MKDESNNSNNRYEYIVIGAGPAGLQLGYCLERAGRNYLILEAGETAGTFYRNFPRHRTLISSNKVYTGYDDNEINLRWDWNSLLSDNDDLLFKNYSKKYFAPADKLVEYLGDFAEACNLKIRYKTRIVGISRDGSFRVEDEAGNAFFAERLIIATGFSKPYLPPIPGIELVEPYTTVSVNPDDFVNQKVLILGKGNSAFETADNLVETAAVIHVCSPNPINLAWKTHHVGHLRAVNNNVLDTYQLKCQNAIIDATVKNIAVRDGKYVVSFDYTHANGEQEDLVYDRVIACTGFRFDASIFDESCRPVLTINNRFPDQTHEWESTNVKDLYIAGTLMQMRDFKKTSSGFIHGFRYNVRSLYRMLEQKYHGVEWEHREVGTEPAELTGAALQRINTSSGLWQQFGFLADLLVVSEDGARYYEEMPLDYIREAALAGRFKDYYTVDMEFGHFHGDPFNITRNPDPAQAEKSVFLHPVVRHYSGTELLAEHHLLEDLAGEWKKEEAHVRPLLNFFEREAGASRAARSLAEDEESYLAEPAGALA